MNRSGVWQGFFVPAPLKNGFSQARGPGGMPLITGGLINRELALKPEISPKSLKPNPETLKPKPPNPTKALLRETLNPEP